MLTLFREGRSQDFSRGGHTEDTHQIVMSTSTPFFTSCQRKGLQVWVTGTTGPSLSCALAPSLVSPVLRERFAETKTLACAQVTVANSQPSLEDFLPQVS